MYLTYWARLLRNQEDFDESSFHFMQRKHLYSSKYSALALLDNSALNQYHAWFAAWNRFGRKIGNRNFLSEDRLKFCKKGRIFKYLRHFSHEIDFFGFNRTLIIGFCDGRYISQESSNLQNFVFVCLKIFY